MVQAAKDVAASFKDNQTEDELITKLKAQKLETHEAKTKGMQLL